MATNWLHENAAAPLLENEVGTTPPDSQENVPLSDKGENNIPQADAIEPANKGVQGTNPEPHEPKTAQIQQLLTCCYQWLPCMKDRNKENGSNNDNNGNHNGNDEDNGSNNGNNGNNNGNENSTSGTANSPENQKSGKIMSMLDVCKRYSITCIKVLKPEDNIIQNLVIGTYALFLIATGMMLVVAQHVKALEHYTFRLPYYFISACMIVAVVLMSVCLYKKDNETLVKFPDRDDPEGTPVTQYLLKNVYIFGAGNFVLDMVHIAMFMQCFGHAQAEDYVASFVFHLCKLVFVFIHVIFLQIFLKHNEVTSVTLFKFVLLHLMATNVLVWFNFIILETGIFDGALHGGHGEHSVLKCNWNGTNITRAIPELADTLSEGLAPFVLEYSLLAMTLLNSMYPYKQGSNSKYIVNQQDSTAEEGSLPGAPCGAPIDYEGANQVVDESVAPDKTVVHRSNLGLMVGLVVVFFIIFPSWLVREYVDYAQHVILLYSSHSVVMLLSAILSLLVFIEIRKYHKFEAQRRLHADDFLLYCTMGASFLLYVVALIMTGISSGKLPLDSPHLPTHAIIGFNDRSSSIRASLIIFAVCNWFDVVGQTFMIIEVRRHRRVPFYEEKHSSTARIRIYLTILALTNATFWFTDSFFDMQSSSWQAYYLPYSFWGASAWLYVSRLFYPFHIFYRFHATSMIAHILLEFKRD